MGAAAGQLAHVRAGLYGELGPGRARRIERAVGHVDRDHARAAGGGDHHRGEPDAAAAVHRNPLARLRAPDLQHRAVGGGEAAAEAGGRRGVDRRRAARRG